YVLEGFSREERAALPDRLARGADAATLAFTAGVEAAMNRYNREPDAGSADEPDAEAGHGTR
ncbi:MAG TPA: hypothetical protein VNH46_11570, partial [Gemmatimonadales bacterium]|nr:hypothetical protein [Gemmatimonadales bacterium]